MATYRHDSEGAWFAAVRGGVILVVPSDAVGELTALWSEFGDGDPTSHVLDRLTAKGLAATPSFALVVRDETADSARVIVRGPITVRSGSDEIHDAGVSSWVERVLDAAASIEIVVGSEVDEASEPLPVIEAVVPVRSVVSDGVEPIVRAKPDSGSPAASDAFPTPLQTPAPPPVVAVPSAVPAVAPPATPAPVTGPAEAADEPALVRASELTMVPDEETVVGSSAAIPEAAPADEIDGDHDGMTVASVDIRRLRAERAARGGAPDPTGAAASVPTPHTPASIRMPDGTLEPIGHELVLGRAPSVSKVSGGRIPRLVTIGLGDPDISRSHVRLALEGDTVVITDLHSRNGTHVVAPGKAPVKLRSGEPTPVLTGTVVDLGGGWTIQVVDG